MNSAQPGQVPDDFPRGENLGSVSGFQQKLLMRKVDGKFIAGLTDEELYARFDACADMVEQLVGYCRRKLAERPEMTAPTLLPGVRRGVASKGWGFSEAELDWIVTRVEVGLRQPPCDSDLSTEFVRKD